MATKLKPLNDRLIVLPIDPEETSSGGVVLPESAREVTQRGVVVALGPGRLNKKGQRISIDVELGATVLHAKYAGGEIKVDGKRLLVMDEADILGIVDNE